MPVLYGQPFKWELRQEISRLYVTVQNLTQEICRLNRKRYLLEKENLALKARLGDIEQKLAEITGSLSEFREQSQEPTVKLMVVK
jgi:predicted  nucleic acid-binding Zn-ribbon protein